MVNHVKIHTEKCLIGDSNTVEPHLVTNSEVEVHLRFSDEFPAKLKIRCHA